MLRLFIQNTVTETVYNVIHQELTTRSGVIDVGKNQIVATFVGSGDKKNRADSGQRQFASPFRMRITEASTPFQGTVVKSVGFKFVIVKKGYNFAQLYQ